MRNSLKVAVFSVFLLAAGSTFAEANGTSEE